jgi:hypothetical protein
MNLTPNFGLKKPEYIDSADIFALNDNADIIDSQLSKNLISVNEISANVKDYKLDTDPDDTLSFQRALADSHNLWVPAGEYNVSDTIKITNGTTIRGVYKQSIINFTADNKTLILGNQDIDNTTGFWNCIVENLDFVGLGISNNQKCMQVKGFLSEINNCNFHGFKTAREIVGVKVHSKNNLTGNCNIGVSIQDYGSAYNTMLYFSGDSFYSNNLGMCNIGDGQTAHSGIENVIDLAMEKCIFESNVKAFNLRPFTGTMKECWFENNTNRPTLMKLGWLFENNRFETGTYDQTFQYLTDTSGTYTGVVETSLRSGTQSIKNLDFQSYDSTAQDISVKSLTEQKIGSENPTIGIADSTDGVTRSMIELNPMTSPGSTPLRFTKLTQLAIKPDGTVYFDGHDVKHTGFSVTKLATGKYKVVFHTSEILGIPQVFATSPTSIALDNDQVMFYCTTRMQCSVGNSDYAAYLGITTLFINTYSRAVGTTTDTLADALIYITLYHK